MSFVGTTNDLEGVGDLFQRKAFYAVGLHWVFYSDGSSIVFQTSPDGVNWSSVNVVRTLGPGGAGNKFSTWFDGTYVHYTLFNANAGLPLYRRGQPNSDGTITWSNEQDVFSSEYINSQPFVCVDDAGYPWIGFRRLVGSLEYPFVTKSSTNDGTWVTATGFPFQLSTVSSGAWRVSIIPLTSQKVLAIYARTFVTIRARRWDGLSWGGEKATVSAVVFTPGYSAVAEDDDVHIVYIRAPTPYPISYCKYVYSSDSFTGELASMQGTTLINTPPVLCRDPTTKTLYVFRASKANFGVYLIDHIYYMPIVNGVAGSVTDFLDESADSLTLARDLTCFYLTYGGNIGLVYMTLTAAPYNVKYAIKPIKFTTMMGDGLTWIVA